MDQTLIWGSFQRYSSLLSITLSILLTACQLEEDKGAPIPDPIVTSLVPSALTISEGRQANIHATTDRPLTLSPINGQNAFFTKVAKEMAAGPIGSRRVGTNGRTGLHLVVGYGAGGTDYIEWNSSDLQVAGVRSTPPNFASVFAYSPGTAVINAGVQTSYEPRPIYSAEATVSVLPVTAQSIELTLNGSQALLHTMFKETQSVSDTVAVGIGDFTRFCPVIKDSVGVTVQRSGITWTSSDVTVVESPELPGRTLGSVPYSGGRAEIHGKKPGAVTVTATFQHLIASAQIKVE